MSTALTEVKNQLVRMEDQFKMSLPPEVSSQKFMRTVITAVSTNSELLSCNRASLYKACLDAAADGCLPDGRKAAIVPYKGQAVYQRMIAGTIEKMHKSGEIGLISAHVVYEGDKFNHYVDENGEHIDFQPNYLGERGHPVLAFSLVKLKDGDTSIEVMTRNEIEAAREQGSAKESLMWKKFPGEAWRKTVLKRHSKRLPLENYDSVVERDPVQLQPVREIPEPEPEPTPELEQKSRVEKIVEEKKNAKS